MDPANRRRWQRFVFPAELQLQAGGRTLAAQVIDLSRGGVQLVLSAGVKVGDTVSGALATSQGTLALAGRVRWMQPFIEPRGSGAAAPPAATATAQRARAGVQLDPLSESMQLQLRALERAVAAETCVVQLGDGSAPLQRVATQALGGLRLELTLPALSAGATVRLRSLHARARARHARIVSARLSIAAGGEATTVELLVEPRGAARKRRYVHYEIAAAPELARAELTHAATTGPDRAAKRRVARTCARALPAAIGVALMGVGVHLDWFEPARATPQPAASPPAAASPALHPPEHPSNAREADARSARSGGSRAPTSSDASGARASAVSDSRHAPPAPSVASRPPPRGLTISHAGNTSEIFVPVTGSLSGLLTKLWIDPPAVVVELPAADIALPERHYDIQAQGIVGISVGKPSGVTQVRVYVNRLLSQYEASAANDGIIIRIERDLRSAL